MWPTTDQNKIQPWLAPPPAAEGSDDFLVVGAGIAGASIARTLAERGCSVRVLDCHGVASGASGNPAAVLRPVLARDPDDPLSRFYSEAFLATAGKLDKLRAQGHKIPGTFAGALHCHPKAQDLRGESKHEYLNTRQVQARLGASAQSHGVWLDAAGWVSPVDYCKALLAHENIEEMQAELSTLSHDGLSWRLLASDDSEITFAENVILANGWRMTQLNATHELPINPVLSQLLHFTDKHAGAGPSVPVVGGGTICPTAIGWMATAGHWHNMRDHRVDISRHYEILERCAALWVMPEEAQSAAARAAVRATSPDYLPLVGGVPDVESAKELYADLQHGRPAHHYPQTPHMPGLYMMGALGGRGITSAQYCAQILDAIIQGQDHAWQRALHPLRFLIRQLKRGKLASADKHSTS